MTPSAPTAVATVPVTDLTDEALEIANLADMRKTVDHLQRQLAKEKDRTEAITQAV